MGGDGPKSGVVGRAGGLGVLAEGGQQEEEMQQGEEGVSLGWGFGWGVTASSCRAEWGLTRPLLRLQLLMVLSLLSVPAVTAHYMVTWLMVKQGENEEFNGIPMTYRPLGMVTGVVLVKGGE